MSRRKGRIIAVESDDKEIDSYLFRPLDPQNPSTTVGPYSNMVTPEYPRPETVLPSSDREPSGNPDGQASDSGENRGSEGGVEIPEEEDGDEESSSELSRTFKKRNLGRRMEADS